MPALELRHGHFSWVDLATPDPAGSLAFYEPLFGWTHQAVPSSGGGYRMLRLKGEAVAGMVGLPPESGIPPCWFSYILVDSVDAAADRIVALLRDQELRRRLGERARKSVQERFLLTRYVEQYLELFASFETQYRLRPHPVRTAAPEPCR